MPAYPTHSFFSHLALQGLIESDHALAGFAQQNPALFRIAGIAGADIQCMPYQVCGHCEAPYRHDQKENRVCLVCKRPELRDFYFSVRDGRRMTRRDVEENLYGNTHLVLYRSYRGYGVPKGKIHESSSAEQPFPEQVVRHVANCLRDAPKIGGRKMDRYIAFVLGWFSHVVSDALFKGVYPHAARVNFFGNQYHMNMLPAAETLTLTDIAQDFGVNWAVWHEELLRGGSDGGALRHLAMGNAPDKYDRKHWTEEFGKPDEAIGRTIDALREINGRWFHEMYTQPDYSAPTPRLDAFSREDRSSARFQNLNLGEVRRYAIRTGWYTTFIRGVEIYLRVIKEAWEKAGAGLARAPGKMASSEPSFSLWRRIVEEADPTGEEWGSALRVENDAIAWIAKRRGKAARIVAGGLATRDQEEVARVAAAKFPTRDPKARAAGVILIGTPQYNRATREMLCVEESLRLKYDSGLAGYVRADGDQLLLCGFSDFGNLRLVEWLKGV